MKKKQTENIKALSNNGENWNEDSFEENSGKKESYIENLLIGVYNELK